MDSSLLLTLPFVFEFLCSWAFHSAGNYVSHTHTHTHTHAATITHIGLLHIHIHVPPCLWFSSLLSCLISRLSPHVSVFLSSVSVLALPLCRVFRVLGVWPLAQPRSAPAPPAHLVTGVREEPPSQHV